MEETKKTSKTPKTTAPKTLTILQELSAKAKDYTLKINALKKTIEPFADIIDQLKKSSKGLPWNDQDYVYINTWIDSVSIGFKSFGKMVAFFNDINSRAKSVGFGSLHYEISSIVSSGEKDATIYYSLTESETIGENEEKQVRIPIDMSVTIPKDSDFFKNRPDCSFVKRTYEDMAYVCTKA